MSAIPKLIVLLHNIVVVRAYQQWQPPAVGRIKRRINGEEREADLQIDKINTQLKTVKAEAPDHGRHVVIIRDQFKKWPKT